MGEAGVLEELGGSPEDLLAGLLLQVLRQLHHLLQRCIALRQAPQLRCDVPASGAGIRAAALAPAAWSGHPDPCQVFWDTVTRLAHTGQACLLTPGSQRCAHNRTQRASGCRECSAGQLCSVLHMHFSLWTYLIGLRIGEVQEAAYFMCDMGICDTSAKRSYWKLGGPVMEAPVFRAQLVQELEHGAHAPVGQLHLAQAGVLPGPQLRMLAGSGITISSLSADLRCGRAAPVLESSVICSRHAYAQHSGTFTGWSSLRTGTPCACGRGTIALAGHANFGLFREQSPAQYASSTLPCMHGIA